MNYAQSAFDIHGRIRYYDGFTKYIKGKMQWKKDIQTKNGF
jgi:hypothetical protein